MIRRYFAAAAIGALGFTAAAGCGGVSDDPRQLASDWVERVCQSVNAGAEKLSKPPKVNLASARDMKDSVVTYLTTVSDALGDTEAELRAAGVPPVHNGIAAYGKALKTTEALQGALAKAVSDLRAAKVEDEQEFKAAMTKVGKRLGKVRQQEGPAEDLKANPELATLFQQTPSCSKV